jgi:hypothetical protein
MAAAERNGATMKVTLMTEKVARLFKALPCCYHTSGSLWRVQ